MPSPTTAGVSFTAPTDRLQAAIKKARKAFMEKDVLRAQRIILNATVPRTGAPVPRLGTS